jgi:hypothetical protein
VFRGHFLSLSRQGKDEICSSGSIRLVLDTPAHTLHYLAADRQADAGALILLLVMQPGEHVKDIAFMLFIDPDTII